MDGVGVRDYPKRSDAGLAAPPVPPALPHRSIRAFRWRTSVSLCDQRRNPPWKRARLDDGEKVYIQFPAGIAQGELPPLFVIGAQGDGQLVNYRFRSPYYIVDRLFGAAELRRVLTRAMWCASSARMASPGELSA